MSKEQRQFREFNDCHPVFNHLDRKVIKGPLKEFKMHIGRNPDVWKSNFVKTNSMVK